MSVEGLGWNIAWILFMFCCGLLYLHFYNSKTIDIGNKLFKEIQQTLERNVKASELRILRAAKNGELPDVISSDNPDYFLIRDLIDRGMIEANIVNHKVIH